MAGIFQNGVWSDGWDHYNSLLQKWDFDSGFGIAINTTNGRFAGSQGLSLGQLNIGAGYAWKNLLTTLSTVIIGFSIKLQLVPNSTNYCLTFYDSVANASQVSLAIDPQGRFQFYIGGGITGGTGTALGPNSGAVAVRGGVWYYLEVKYTASTTVGLAELRLNGNSSPIISFSGNTQSTTNAWTDRIVLGINTLNNSYNYDDLYILDTTGAAPLNTYLGDTRIVTVFPNADSATAGLNQFSTSPAQAAGSHYLNVDENPPDDNTSYNFDSVVNDRESYRHTAATVTGSIPFVNAWARFEKDDATTRQVAIVTRSNVTDVVGPTVNVPSSYVYANQVTVVDPNTAAAWTQAGVNAAEFGLKIIS